MEITLKEVLLLLKERLLITQDTPTSYLRPVENYGMCHHIYTVACSYDEKQLFFTCYENWIDEVDNTEFYDYMDRLTPHRDQFIFPIDDVTSRLTWIDDRIKELT